MRKKDEVERLLYTLGENEKRGDWINFHCPEHKGSRLNFGVNLKQGFYKCLGCGVRGSLDSLLDLLKTGSYESTTRTLKRSEKATGRQRKVLESEEWCRGLDPVYRAKGVTGDLARSYLLGRGVDPSSVQVYLHNDLAGRVVFLFERKGKPVYYVARAFAPIEPKVKNPTKGEGWCGKQQVMWNEDSFNDSTTVVITEGIFDALLSDGALPNHVSTCLLGKDLSSEQTFILKGAGVRSVLIFLDSDAQDNAYELCARFYQSGYEAKVVVWEYADKEKDPASVGLQECTRLMGSAVSFTDLPQEVRLQSQKEKSLFSGSLKGTERLLPSKLQGKRQLIRQSP
jgi:DNA primase